MASIRKQYGKWHVQIRLKNLRKTRSFESKAEAQAWALEQEQHAGRHGGVVCGRSFGEAMQKYVDEVSPLRKGMRWEQVRLQNCKGIL